MGIVTSVLSVFALLGAYIYTNDQKLRAVPAEVLKDYKPWTESFLELADKSDTELAIDLKDYLGEKTGRRYIVVGGAGFLGGWIVLHLLERGESPQNIRILDMSPPKRPDIQSILKTTSVSFVKADITDPSSLRAAFATPWPADADTHQDITLFHTAANIRYFERDVRLFHLSTKVNVDGTRNVLDAAKKAGDVSVFIYTGSGSIGIRDTRFLLWPWETRPAYMVQYIDDSPHTNGNGCLPVDLSEHIGNYPRSKRLADSLVQNADMDVTSSGKRIRTGVLRPSNPVYGPAADTLVTAYMEDKTNYAWSHQTRSSLIYVENCSLGHLAYERTLLSYGPSEKGYGGRSYCLTDGGPAPMYGDMFNMIQGATDGEVTFPVVSPTFMLLLGHVMETLYLAKRLLPSPLCSLVPNVPATLVPLQPPVFGLTVPHTIFSDNRARKEIGYRTPWTSQTGTWETIRSKMLKGEGKGVKVMWKGVGGGVPVGEVNQAASAMVETLGLQSVMS